MVNKLLFTLDSKKTEQGVGGKMTQSDDKKIKLTSMVRASG